MGLNAQARFLLIPVAYALPAVQAYLADLPEDGAAMTPEELRALAQLTTLVIKTSELLTRFVVELAGTPAKN